MTDGWGQSASGGWGSPDDGWASGGSGGSTDPGFGSGWGSGSGPRSAFVLPSPVSIAPLLVGIALGTVGILLSFLGTATSVAAPVAGWLLCTFGDVLAVAAYQRRDMAAAFGSMNYRSAASAPALRWVALGLAAVGIVANSLAIAQWVATR